MVPIFQGKWQNQSLERNQKTNKGDKWKFPLTYNTDRSIHEEFQQAYQKVLWAQLSYPWPSPKPLIKHTTENDWLHLKKHSEEKTT